ncbi:MAG: hypothetical protein COA78_17700 [Blastopirellula sp.]|nr:MAG: hypothetical protein COA78_17700 [Blastopirellula sp.]
MKWLPKIRFSMRTLFILVTLLCVLLVPLSVKLYQARQQRLAVELLRANGAEVDYFWDRAIPIPTYSRAITHKIGLRRALGRDFFEGVLSVRITDPSAEDISHLPHLGSRFSLTLIDPHSVDLSPLYQRNSINIHFTSETSFTAKSLAALSKSGCPLNVDIKCPSIDDLSPIQQLSSIRRLTIDESQITDLAPLSHLTQLEELRISRTPVNNYSPLKEIKSLKTLRTDQAMTTDFSSLSGLTQLELLYLREPSITDLTPLAKLVNLRGLLIHTPQAKDLSPLENLVNLKTLRLPDTQAPKSQISKLEKALPNCSIEKHDFMIFLPNR